MLGRPRHFLGPVKVIGMHYGRGAGGLCIFFDMLRAGSGRGTCSEDSPLPSPGDSIQHLGTSTSDYKRRPVTSMDGVLTPDVARVRAKYWRRGAARTRHVRVVQVAGELQERVREPEPFGLFEMTARGCIADKKIRLKAYAADGTLLQRMATFRAGGLCNTRGTVATLGAPRHYRFSSADRRAK